MVESLDKWIQDELTIDPETEIMKHRDTIKRFIALTESGEIIIRNTQNLRAHEKVWLLILGKYLANCKKYVPERTVTNKEIERQLNMREGTVKTSLFRLRKDNWIQPVEEGVHQIKYDTVETAINIISSRVN